MRTNSMANDIAGKAGEVRKMSNASLMRSFRSIVWNHWKKQGRHGLPWRKTTNPYRILVSEMMLQQTQVSRVIEKYKEFLRAFPTVQALAAAPLSEVLKVWSGLGYNRRGKYLHDTAKIFVEKHRGNVKAAIGILKLPGVGEYTGRAVRVFAFNEPHILVETNIRTALIHHFFNSHTLYGRGDYGNQKQEKVEDRELMPLIEATMPKHSRPDGGPREWYWALMDYGAYLKQSGVRNNSASRHYTKQSKFKGSLREVRGAILRELHKGPSYVKKLPFDKESIEKAVAALIRDGLVVCEAGRLRIS